MKANDNLNIFIAFHISSDASVNASLKYVGDTMEQYFHGEYVKVIETNNDNDCEVIYKIQQPLMVSEKNHGIFFDKLRKLFYKTEDMIPHFTQFDESTLHRN